MQSSFRMVMRSGPTVGKVYPLEKGELFVGRDLSNDIVINDPEISRRHSRLFAQGNAYYLEDLGSTNGTFINGQRLMGPAVLRPGDVVTFGERMSLVFESSDFDQDATMVSPAARPSFDEQGPVQVYNEPQQYNPPAQSYPQQPSYPPQQQAYPQGQYAGAQPQRPVGSYAGQVPSAYAPEAPAGRRLSTTWIVVIVLLLLSCLCLAVAAWNAPEWFWCLFPVWPAGACP
jgi:pSer/pThr/pTyr-binding forkhead associated (FHA) protein